jgi:uncharacterized membrane protein
MRIGTLIAFSIVLLAFGISVFLYPQMPGQIGAHWNARGEVDGYLPKFLGLFLIPTIMSGLFLLLLFIPKVDPLKKNIKKFQNYFDGFIILVTLFFFYIHALTIAWTLGARFNMGQALVPAMGALFYYSGILIEHSKRNWFIGIRTPWTLSSDAVWDKTHKRGAALFKVAGVVTFAGAFFPGYAIALMIGPILVASLYLFLYSYLVYKKHAH